MALTPLNGFVKKVADLPDRPNASMTSTEVKAQFDAAVEELRVFLNSKLAQIDTDFSLKSEIANALLGQILDGSLTDVKLSNTAGQAKDRLSKVITDLANFIATKGLANGFGSLGSDGKAPLAQMPTSLMVASARTVLSDVPALSRTTSENNAPTNGNGNWFTMMNKSITKTKGMRSLFITATSPLYNNQVSGGGGSGYASNLKLSVNGVVISTGTGSLNITYDINAISDGSSISVKYECQPTVDITGNGYAYATVTTKTNEVYDVL